VVQDLFNEVAIQERLNNPHVLPFVGLSPCICPPGFAIVSPYMVNGTINDYLAHHPNADVMHLVRKSRPFYVYGL
jgi:hypothetical protein